MFGGHKKDRGFSSGNKVQQYHGNGIESIVLMGKPFRVLQKISDVPAPYLKRRLRHEENKDMGSFVYLVENSSRLSEFPRHLALKRSIYNVDKVTEAHKEIELLSRIKDKNIIRVYHSEISRSEGRLGVSIAMEYCGNNLYRRMRSGSAAGAGTRLTESEICQALFAITSAVGYLHSQQPPIAHRDLRPENILINNNFTGPAAYKLANFASATTEAYECANSEESRMAIEDIEQNTNAGFRSPEMADPSSGKRICEKSDMWSLGVLLHFMMFQKLPFEPVNSALCGNPKVDVNRLALKSGYTPSLLVVLDHLIEPDLDRRWDIFALTNFLRFDEDVSRHLGTFCFTRTELPEGWEEQDVKVMYRDPPAKAPPVHYTDDNAHDTIADVAAQAAGQPRERPSAAPSAGSPAPRPNADAVREAMIVLGGDDASDDPEMAKYREQIMREQQEAWENAKRAAGRPADAPTTTTAAPAAAAPAATPSPKKDAFDDLFAAPEPQQQQQQQGQAPPPEQPPKKDMFSADDLFAAPAPPQQQQGGYPMPYNAPNPAMGGGAGGYGGGWGTGSPVPVSGGGWSSGAVPPTGAEYCQQRPV
ncbi:AP2-associated kinase [Strigomonas culicis]|uniref:non-specific serine/threonine protein kinase n=1 Tax=Strigomonas culicis TaxID=28005 RepID=S9VLX7_9TRYP|nr:AP2-associated kinase [Strigomonas culicis]|eukprot:EPY24210.1 AP2-associated kinase [Strigomonas culicis]